MLIYQSPGPTLHFSGFSILQPVNTGSGYCSLNISFDADDRIGVCGRLHHVCDSCCVCRVSGVEESVKVIKQQCESTDGLALFSAEGPSAPVTGGLIGQAEKSLHHQR